MPFVCTFLSRNVIFSSEIFVFFYVLFSLARALIGCGSVVNNTLASPGYPNNYPSNMDCNYSVPIANGKAIKIYFHDLVLEDAPFCS